MSVFAEQLSAYLDQSGLQYQQSDASDVFQMCFDSEHGINRVLVLVADDLLQIFTYPPNKVIEAHRLAIAHAVTRANFGLRIGQFELDVDDGDGWEVRRPLGSLLCHGVEECPRLSFNTSLPAKSRRIRNHPKRKNKRAL